MKIQWKYRNWSDERLEKSGDERAKIYKRNRDFGHWWTQRRMEEDPVFGIFVADRNKRIKKGMGLRREARAYRCCSLDQEVRKRIE